MTNINKTEQSPLPLDRNQEQPAKERSEHGLGKYRATELTPTRKRILVVAMNQRAHDSCWPSSQRSFHPQARSRASRKHQGKTRGPRMLQVQSTFLTRLEPTTTVVFSILPLIFRLWHHEPGARKVHTWNVPQPLVPSLPGVHPTRSRPVCLNCVCQHESGLFPADASSTQ